MSSYRYSDEKGQCHLTIDGQPMYEARFLQVDPFGRPLPQGMPIRTQSELTNIALARIWIPELKQMAEFAINRQGERVSNTWDSSKWSEIPDELFPKQIGLENTYR